MSSKGQSRIPEILEEHEASLLGEWIDSQLVTLAHRRGVMRESELREQCGEFLRLLRRASASGDLRDLEGETWSEVRDMLARVTRSRGQQGFTPSETATFVFSLKKPIFERLRNSLAQHPDALAEETWLASELLDRLGLFTTEVHQKSREQIITRQQQEMLELSTPVVKLWDGILALPLIGTLDSARTQIVMESLLQRIVETGSTVAIIDITGVPTVDTLVAQHLIKTVTAARLMGADCIISGIRPQIAQTIVHLGVDLGKMQTKASLEGAFRLALQRTGQAVRQLMYEKAEGS